MKKALCFRNSRFGGNEYAQRDHIEYVVHHSMWQNGKSADQNYYISRRDIKNRDYLNTETVKRFDTREDAMQYCQDMYDGKVDISALKAEIQAVADAKQRDDDRIALEGADKFKTLLNEKQVTLSHFLEIVKLWGDTCTDSRTSLYKESEGMTYGNL